MVILHISAISGEKSSGMSVVVPEHVKNQSNLAETAMFNCMDYVPENAKDAYKVFLSKNYKEFDISKLEKPFSKPDLVVFHGIYISYYIKIYKNLLKHHIPYIVLPHGSLTEEAQRTKRTKKLIANLMLFNQFIKHAIYIQYLSESERKHSYRYKVKNFVLGNGIYVPENKLKVYKDLEKIKFVYIGRLEIYFKGLDILIQAINCVQDKIRSKNVMICIYGPIDEQGKKLQKMIKALKIDDIVEISDAVYGEEKRKVLLDSDVFIQTSRSEGQPMGIMEAMGYGLPCIITEGTTFKDIIEENKCGYVTECKKEDVANKILDVIEHKTELKRLSENSYNYAKKNLDWKKISEESIKRYREIIRK